MRNTSAGGRSLLSVTSARISSRNWPSRFLAAVPRSSEKSSRRSSVSNSDSCWVLAYVATRSTVVLPMPRGGVLMMRSMSTSLRGLQSTRKYAMASLISARS